MNNDDLNPLIKALLERARIKHNQELLYNDNPFSWNDLFKDPQVTNNQSLNQYMLARLKYLNELSKDQLDNTLTQNVLEQDIPALYMLDLALKAMLKQWQSQNNKASMLDDMYNRYEFIITIEEKQ